MALKYLKSQQLLFRGFWKCKKIKLDTRSATFKFDTKYVSFVTVVSKLATFSAVGGRDNKTSA